MIHFTDNRLFILENPRINYIFRVSDEGLLEHVYFGARINRREGGEAHLPIPRRIYRNNTLQFEDRQNLSLGDIPQEYPVFGCSDERHPALHVVNADGNSTTVLRYVSHEIASGKPDLDGLPGARGDDCETLTVTLADEVTRLRVELRYSVFARHDVIARSVNIINDGEEPVELINAFSTNLDLPAAEYDLLHLRGSWAREFHEQRMPVPNGRFIIDSTSGSSSNHHNPFMAVMPKDTTQFHGAVIGMALVYSGNFAIHAEKGEFDSVRIGMGVNPFNFKWRLDAGESFACPEALQVFSEGGLNGMSQVWHGFIQQQLSPPGFSAEPRPTYLNTWEALYFHVTEEKVLQLADKAKALGLEMLVVDDGWFQGRSDDHRALGDWIPDPVKFPNGINEVGRQVNEKGLKFGLWFEPEMVNANSDLYRAHPEWVIQSPNRKLSTGRNQLILDLSQQAVVDHLFEKLDAILGGGHIDYVKWDMNRRMSEVGSTALSRERQSETPHRHILGLYSLLERITGKYPHILFENCASGGNRFDLGMLSYMPQGWVSDMTDPVGRLEIINGASYLFPPNVLASYICPVPNHQNGRVTSLKMRAEVGFFCAARGLSLNTDDMEKHWDELLKIAAFYKQSAEHLATGRFHRLHKTANETVWQLNSADGKTVYLGYFHILASPSPPYRRARLVELEPDAEYHCLQDAGRPGSDPLIFSGDALMRRGVDLPYVRERGPHEKADAVDDADYMDSGDFSSRLMIFTKQP